MEPQTTIQAIPCHFLGDSIPKQSYRLADYRVEDDLQAWPK
jgi:hypothetical protein